MISLKKFLDGDLPVASPAVESELKRESGAGSVTEHYRAALLAIGRSAAQCSGSGDGLEKSLQGLERRLSVDPSEKSVKWAQEHLEVQLQEWGARTAEHFKAKADEVKELLIALARTAESVGDRTQGQTSQFRELCERLESIADLDDLTQIRSSLVRRVTELKNSVDRMTRDNEQLVAHLRSEVTKYETRLKEVEHLVMKDELTGVANRRSVEERAQRQIANARTFLRGHARPERVQADQRPARASRRR